MNTPPTSSSLRVAIAAAACLVTLTAIVPLAGCARADGPATPAPPTGPSISGEVVSFPEGANPPGVRHAAVDAQGAQRITVPGRLAWDEDRTTRIHAPFAGRIERLRVSVGQPVKAGQPLADVQSADVGQAQADWHKAQADLAVARASHERVKDLVDNGVLARKELQQAEADLARATAEATRTKARLSSYGVSGSGVTQALSLASRIDGIVVERNGNTGTEVRADVQGAPLFTVSDPTSLWVTLDVDETQLALFKVGQAIELRCAAWPDDAFTAKVLSIGESVDPASRTIKVRARVPNADRKLKAEMFVNASLQRTTEQLVVPADAVFLRGDKSFVFVQQGPGRYERRPVSVRSSGSKQWTVTQGLSKTDQVVTGGGLYLNQLLDAAR